MRVKVENTGPCRKTLQIEVPTETVNDSYEKTVTTFVGAAKIPGYRKGKAPRQLVERHFAKAILDEVRDALISDSYTAAIAEKKINPVAVLDLTDVALAPGSPMKFKVVLDVPPQFKLPRYKKITLKPHKVEVSEEQVQQRLNALLESHAEYKAVEDRPVMNGDLVQVDYDGLCDGKPIDVDANAGSLARGRNIWFATGQTVFLPGFAEALVGMKPGDTKEIKTAFPLDFRRVSLAGKSVVYRVVVKAVRERNIPQINDDFLRKVKMDSEQALRSALRTELEALFAHNEKERLKGEIISYLLKNTTIDLPESVVQEETRVMLSSLIHENIRRGMSDEQFKEKRDEMLGTAAKSAADRVKLGYILHRIAEEEKIEVEEAEVTKAIQELADRWGVDPETVGRELEKRREMDAIRGDILCDKTLKFMLENAGSEEDGLFRKLIKGEAWPLRREPDAGLASEARLD